MEFALVVYLISILDNVKAFLVTGIITCCLITFCMFLFEYSDFGEFTHKKTAAFLIFISVVFGILCAIIPSEQNAYKIAAAYGAQQVYQSDEAKEVGKKLMIVINNKLDEMGEKK
jgi:hypothetical protein